MNTAKIMRLTNQLLDELENSGDEILVDLVCTNISCNTPFNEDEIAAAEEGDDPEW